MWRSALRGLLASALILGPSSMATAQERNPEEARVLAVAEEARVLAVAQAALDAISREDMIAFTDLMIEEAVVSAVVEVDGVGRYTARTRARERATEFPQDIVERGFDPRILMAGPVATVWLPYDLYLDGAWSHCGVDTFTLLRVDGQWRIASLAYTVQQPPDCRPHPDGPPSE